jgi:hypothetical protein
VGDGPTGAREGEEEDAPPSLSLSLSLFRCFASFDCFELCKKIIHIGRSFGVAFRPGPGPGCFFGPIGFPIFTSSSRFGLKNEEINYFHI